MAGSYVGKGTKADRVRRPGRSQQARLDELDDRVRHLYVEVAQGSGGGRAGVRTVVAVTLAMTGPGAGVVPLQRTYDDGTVVDYTYKADGWTVDQKTVAVPGEDPVTYLAVYAASGVRSKWAPL